MTHATLERPPQTPRRSLPPISTILLVLVGALLCVGMTLALTDPDVVPRVTVANDSTIPINVQVRATGGGPRLILDTVQPGSTASTNDVIDQGDRWIFSFSSGGVDGGTYEVTRAKLAADDWRIRVPDDVIAKLRSGTFVPSYR
jgi:hypothetical protein